VDPKIIAQVWQAFSTLSDAQDLLGQAGTTAPSAGWEGQPLLGASNERINHAKRHLQHFIQWAQENHQEAFMQAIQSSITCSLESVETHDEEL
jgi:hypothetical protein